MKVRILPLIAITITQCISVNISAEEPTHQYTTRDEKRESAHRYEITDWLSLSAIAEVEQGRKRLTPLNGTKSNTEDFSKSVDIEISFEASDSIEGEVVFEFDDETDKFLVDEAVAVLELGKTEIELGKTYLPLGEYFSHFSTGSPVDFAETRATGIIVSHTLKESIDLSLFVYNGKAEKNGTGNDLIDWGIAVEITPREPWKLGLSYVSDLADADSISLNDDRNCYSNQVGGLGVWSALEFGNFGVTAEYITALSAFEELETDQNKPSAWNLELAYFMTEKLEWAVRFAGSKEVDAEPRQQMGIAGTWHINNNIRLTIEYLRNDFKAGQMDREQQSINKSRQTAGRLSILF